MYGLALFGGDIGLLTQFGSETSKPRSETFKPLVQCGVFCDGSERPPAQCGVFCDRVLEHARAVMVNNCGQRRRSNGIHDNHTDNTTFVITRAQYVQCMNVPF